MKRSCLYALFLSGCLLLSGCDGIPIISPMIRAHQAKKEAAKGAAVGAATVALDTKVTALQTQFTALQTADKAALDAKDQEISNLKAGQASELARRQTGDAYVISADDRLQAAASSDDPNIIAAKVLVHAARKTGNELTADQLAWIQPIVAELVSKDQVDLQKATAAIAAAQVATDAKRAAEGVAASKADLLAQHDSDASKAASVASDKVTGLNGEVSNLRSKLSATTLDFTSYTTKVTAILIKHGFWHSVVKDAILSVLAIIFLVAGVKIAEFYFPEVTWVVSLSGYAEKALGKVGSYIFKPVHTFLAWLEAKFTAKRAAATPIPAPVPPVKSNP